MAGGKKKSRNKEEPALEANPVMPGVSPNIDWPISRDLGEPYRVGLGPKPSPGSTSWPFQPMPHQEGHLLVNTRLVRAGKILLCLLFYLYFLKLIIGHNHNSTEKNGLRCKLYFPLV